MESVCSLASLPGLTTLDASGTGLEEHASAISRKFGDSVRVLVKGARESWNQA